MQADTDFAANSPILLIPYMWIGDFVRCHSVVRVLQERFPRRPLDLLTNELCAPLIDYMPGVRKGIVFDLPRGRIPLGRYRELARLLKREGYGTALVMLRTWKSALAPFLAGIPQRTGFVGEGRFILINDLRWGERRLRRMVDRCGVLALPKGEQPPREWPVPALVVPPAEIAAWRERLAPREDGRRTVALGPGAIGPGKAWPPAHYAELARRLAAGGAIVWVLGGPREEGLAAQIAAAAGPLARALTSPDLRQAIIALAAADAAVTNDSGLMHVAAAIGTPTVAIFGPTEPGLWGPLNVLAATLEPPAIVPCPICGGVGCHDVRHRRTEDVAPERVFTAVQEALAQTPPDRPRGSQPLPPPG
jgi:heptosyltransferase-2